MRNILFVLSIYAFSCRHSFAQLSPSETGAVTGHIYCADSQTPCRFASVTIQTAPSPKAEAIPKKPAQPSHAYTAATDIGGAFQINGVLAGEYYILARLAGYLSTYGVIAGESQTNPLSDEAVQASLTRIDIEPGKATVTNLTLSRGASLGGTVRYDDGGLGINLPVHLFRRDAAGKWAPYNNNAGDSDLAPLGFALHTDDRGRFYEPALPPGFYAVEATLPESSLLPSTILGRQSLSVTMVPGDALRVFNGSKNRLSDAPPIELHQGEDRPDVDLTIPTSGLHSIRGVATMESHARRLTRGSVRLLDQIDGFELRETTLREDASFQFNYVPDGSYLVQIECQTEAQEGKVSARYAMPKTPLLVQSDILDLSYDLFRSKD